MAILCCVWVLCFIRFGHLLLRLAFSRSLPFWNALPSLFPLQSHPVFSLSVFSVCLYVTHSLTLPPPPVSFLSPLSLSLPFLSLTSPTIDWSIVMFWWRCVGALPSMDVRGGVSIAPVSTWSIYWMCPWRGVRDVLQVTALPVTPVMWAGSQRITTH